MKKLTTTLLIIVLLTAFGCKKQQNDKTDNITTATNIVTHASGLEIYRYDGYSVVKVTAPWPDAEKGFTYVMQQKGVTIPDSLSQYSIIPVPIKTVVVTSTTHIPSLEMLGVENSLVGFPGTNYISSEKTRARIDAGKVREAGANESLNTEVMIDLSPDAVVGFSISGDNKTLSTLEETGTKVLYNGDWTEQSPLGKAEWIKFFGELYGLQEKADSIFNTIEKDYKYAQNIAKNAKNTPTVLSGAMYQDHWYLPQGGSWGALFMKDAHAEYLWADSDGTGSHTLSFETVLDKAQNADYWVGPSQFTSLHEMVNDNPHYAQFKAFQDKQVYSFATKTGATGGLLYYEVAPNRPDLVLKDLVKILHPELLPDYELHFFEKLK
ncbi:ABC transporter substrate-binding protein [Flavobacterium salilacus subsp. salilacus]|uniref:ABC transporter substrate-binding protein n=1 Tax=Flavobacterium TaxID=237 RepID=UPI001074ACD9|nr:MULTISPECIES: ABC transporter substrate-binding protein [Flavobacterium]KAF2518473.1 ABC transporter substrate-binding protein [Flavobacterium salilacus subsp. salilacus]MBE1615112.1 ABC transporter substrate-binding protein [Flavobacterium sp. SaA2.13]